MHNVHTFFWILGLLGLSGLPVWLSWHTFQHPVVLLFGGALTFAALFLCVLAYHGRTATAPASATHTGYLRPYAAVLYLLNESRWGVQAKADGKNNAPEALHQLRETASRGLVRIYGQHSQTHEYEEIPETHWMGSRISDSSASGLEAESRTVPAEFGTAFNKDEIVKYYDLRIKADDVYRTWTKK
jgi:hypothetical protein